MEAALGAGITLGCAVSGGSQLELQACRRAGDLQPLGFGSEKHGVEFAAACGARCSPPAAWSQALLKGSAGFTQGALLPKGSWLITGPSAVDNSSVFMVMMEESNLQPVA